MISREQFESAQQRAREYLSRAGIIITPEESANIEVADFGLNELDSTGLELVVYVNTDRVCAKELVLFPRQTCPEHYHPPIAGEPARKRLSVVAGERSICMCPVRQLRIRKPILQRGVKEPITSGTRLSFDPAINTLSCQTHRTGSRLEMRARLCPSSPPAAATSQIFSRIRRSNARHKSRTEPL